MPALGTVGSSLHHHLRKNPIEYGHYGYQRQQIYLGEQSTIRYARQGRVTSSIPLKAP